MFLRLAAYGVRPTAENGKRKAIHLNLKGGKNMNLIKKMLRDQSGQGMVEYGLIVALIAVALIAAFGLLGTEISALFGRIVATLRGV